MIVCSSCHRHIRASERGCPFCGEPLRSTSPIGLLLAGFAGVLGLVACSDAPVSQDDEAGTTTAMSAGETDTTTTSTETTSTETTSTETTSTETTSTETTSTNDTVDGGLSFYAGPSPDDFPSALFCDPFAQDCPEGEKCVPTISDGWNSNMCVPIVGEGQQDDPCTWGPDDSDDCGYGLVCWPSQYVDGQPIGACTPLCQGTADAPMCPDATSCVITNDGAVTLCFDDCNPLLQDCEVGQACYGTFNGDTVFFCSFPAAPSVPVGESCAQLNDCEPGHFCSPSQTLPDCDGVRCCTGYCDLTSPSCELPGTQCVPFFEQGMAPLGFENVGLCLLPP